MDLTRQAHVSGSRQFFAIEEEMLAFDPVAIWPDPELHEFYCPGDAYGLVGLEFLPNQIGLTRAAMALRHIGAADEQDEHPSHRLSVGNETGGSGLSCA